MNLRTPLARARGLGSAKEGTGHWWAERLSSLALVPLTLWFVYAVVSVSHAGYLEAIHWIGRPFNAVMLVLFLGVTFWHGALGLAVIIEDYVHHKPYKFAALMVVKFTMVVLGAMAIFSVLRIAFGG